MIHEPDKDLTVVIPTKDRPQFLNAAVASALAGLPENAEVLVVDDRSMTPVTAQIAGGDTRVRITSSEARPGASGARNWGVAHARGRRIAFLDDDDLLIPGYLAWVVQQGSDYGFSPTTTFRGLEVPVPGAFVGGQGQSVSDARHFRHQIAGLGCGFWIERSAFQTVGGIAEEIRVNEDTEFSIRLLRAGMHGVRAPAPGVMVRQHHGVGGQRGHLTAAETARERAGFFAAILARHADWLAGNPNASRHLLKRQLKLLARARDVDGARAALASPLAAPHRFLLRVYFAAALVASQVRRR